MCSTWNTFISKLGGSIAESSGSVTPPSRALRGAELQGWTRALVEAGDRVHEHRQTYVERLAPAAAEIGTRLLGSAVRVDYRAGWADGLSFAEALTDAEGVDRAQGTTRVGPHRADLEVMLEQRGVRDEASRGQQKLVAAALVLGQVRVHHETRRTPGVLLVDDPGAELDQPAQARLLETLDEIPAQLIITGLSAAQLPPRPGFPVFHVERGNVHGAIMFRFNWEQVQDEPKRVYF